MTQNSYKKDFARQSPSFSKKSVAGFTLIELLVVIAIIGILSSVVLASLSTARLKARDVRRISDIKQIQLALELYADANSSSFPPGADNAALSVLAPSYLPTLPTDPSNLVTYHYQALLDSSGTACAVAGTCFYYHLGASLEDTNNAAKNNDADACAAAGAGCQRVVSGTTINGADSAKCNASDAGVLCYDVTP